MTPTATAAPERSLQQRRDALEHANEIRTKRAQLKRDLSRPRAATVIADPPRTAEGMHIGDLLIAVPKIGRVRVARILADCAVSPSKTLGGLSDRQRAALIATLRGEP